MPKFEWDPDKAANNPKRHRGVTFEDAIPVFDDDRALDEEDPDPDEDRRKMIGMVAGRVLVVVYTEREDRIRIISARKATPDEVKAYHDQG
jgi:uncharacterized DUF497 family protein